MVLRTDLLPNYCRLVIETNLVLVAGAFDDFIHGVESVLYLLHQSPFPLEPLLLIELDLLHHADQLLFELRAHLLRLLLPLREIFFGLTLYLCQHSLDHLRAVVCAVDTHSDIFRFLILKLLPEAHLVVSALFDPVHKVRLNLPNHLSELLRHPVGFNLKSLPLLTFVLQLVTQESKLRFNVVLAASRITPLNTALLKCRDHLPLKLHLLEGRGQPVLGLPRLHLNFLD